MEFSILKNVDSSDLHGSAFLESQAQRIQYVAHSPQHIEELFQKAIVYSPADYQMMISYADYLKDRNCCKREIANLFEAALQRNPRSRNLQTTVVVAQLQAGNLKAASQALKSIQATSYEKEQLYRKLLNDGADSVDIRTIVEPTPENVLPLLKIMAAKGDRQDWSALYSRIASQRLDVRASLDLSKQALQLREYEIAKQHALIASQDSETKKQALFLINRIERQQKKRK